MKVRISARQSELAQLQARAVGQALQKAEPRVEIAYRFRESLGDLNQMDPLWKMPEKGVFTEDFYRDLVTNETDLVVHSWKDLPTQEKTETFIAATLPREDQRDLLIFKKKSTGRAEVRIFSSSPRRAFNLSDFLKKALPFAVEQVEFRSVRGNIATRLKKFLADDQIDGLVLAKAALDRLLSDPATADTAQLIRNILQHERWMVLPLSANPNAAAQGALAIEARRDHSELLQLLKKINCDVTYKSAQKERELLQSFGGGCHLALGMAVLHRPYGEITIVRGKTPDGVIVAKTELNLNKKVPANLPTKKIKFLWNREPQPYALKPQINALYVSKSEAWQGGALDHFSGLVWTAGLSTWFKLAKSGVWVNGSAESLGDREKPDIEGFFSEPLNWGLLTHSSAPLAADKETIATYKAECEVDPTQPEIDFSEVCVYQWGSTLEYQAALKRWPQIREQLHACGPGRTHSELLKILGGDERLYINWI